MMIYDHLGVIRPNFKVCPVCGHKMKYVWVVENGGGGVNFIKPEREVEKNECTKDHFEPYRCEWCGFLRLVPNEEAW